MEIKDVENLADLARIELSLEEKQEILKDMKGILEYVKVIEGVEIDVQRSVLNNTNYNIWREDEIIPRDFSRELIIEQFPDSQDGFLKVKKIL
jgi:aspartyl-tRNA(Asn)/glutamyl-tRNA(Gln) amidotransferase subunit C